MTSSLNHCLINILSVNGFQWSRSIKNFPSFGNKSLSIYFMNDLQLVLSMIPHFVTSNTKFGSRSIVFSTSGTKISANFLISNEHFLMHHSKYKNQK